MLVRRLEKKHADDVSSDKVLSLSAYTSGVLLLIFALFIIIEAAELFFSLDVEIRYTEAMIVAAVGMVSMSFALSSCMTNTGMMTTIVTLPTCMYWQML